MLGSPAGPGGPSQRSLWPLAPAPAPSATSFTTDGFGKCGVYSLFPGGPSFGSALYSHARTIGQFTSSHIQQSSGNPFHHKDSLFSSAGYTFGAPTPPPGSPYSPVPVTQFELLAKGFNSNIIIQQPSDYPLSPKKLQIQDKNRCDEKCCLKQQKPCDCNDNPQPSNLKKPNSNSSATSAIITASSPIDNSGCSRTNPIEWSNINVKKEPGSISSSLSSSNPCQVAEITTSVSPVVKLEVTSPKNGNEPSNGLCGNIATGGNSNTANNIPVGIAVARQRYHQQEVVGSPSLPPAGLLTTVNAAAQIKEVSRISEIESAATAAGMAAAGTTQGVAGGVTGSVNGGGTLLQCTDDRSGLASWQMGGTHNSTLTTPTLWQYPAPVPMEPMVPLPVPMPPVGFQLVRDPTTGGLLLLPTTGIEPLQQAVVWPSYHQPPSVLLPPLPPPPLQLLSSASSDYLSSSTTLHQHTQTHSTRLVALTTDNKRKIPLPIPTTTLIKIETDATTLDQTKTLQAVSTIASNTGTVFTDQPLVTTHVIYQHPTNLILSSQPQPSETICRSQATSPVACLTPPPETATIQEETASTTTTTAVQDASNQTDTPICSEDDNTVQPSDLQKNKEEPSEEICSASANTPVPDVQDVLPKPSQEEPEQVQEITSHQEDKITSSSSPQPPPEPIIEDKLKPDLSGLELLSNSIEEFENCRNTIIKTEPETPTTVTDNLGGLDLLCALAEQRILEESTEKREKERTRKKEKRKSKKHSDEPKRKKSKHHSEDRDHRSKKRRESQDNNKNCCCRAEDSFRTYKTPESEEEVKKFIASKIHNNCCKGDWPCMNEMELDMRMKLADLQRQYREKQKELSKLKPKKHECSKKRPRKKSTHSPQPPVLEKVEAVPPPPKPKAELLKPPVLCPFESPPPPKSPKLEAFKPSDRIINDYKNDLLRQKALEDSSAESSPEKNSSSKKRKVGRPKKLSSPAGSLVATETIVAKKPKNNFVGYLLAAKEKFKLQSKLYTNSPPRYVDETTITHKTKKNKNNNNIIVEEVKSCKIRPKLKAEPTVKSYDEDEWESQEEEEDDMEEEENDEILEEEDMILEEDQNDDIEMEVEKDDIDEEEIVEEEDDAKNVDDRCILTAEHLEIDKLRVLTAMGGLFYAGHLNAVQPPDVYSITLDGERGNRPHIMSREEILRDAIVEVSPKSTDELSVGTRLCAYWSQQYRCLYPGSVAEPGTPDPALDSKFVAVEFDDGDSGRIALEDIRLLPPDYPIIEYDPNPLLSLSKRRRRTSTCASIEDRRSSQPLTPSTLEESIKQMPDLELEKENKDINKPDELHKERKRLKKKKKEKQKLLHEDKKKKRKHKCTEEFCKHKKHHKKHRKHKKKHHYVVSNIEQALPTVIEENDDDEIAAAIEDEEPSEEDYEEVMNPEDEVTRDDILEACQSKKSKKIRDRQESCESRSKISAFLPARQLWRWNGKGYKRPRAKGRSRKQFYRSIQRGKEIITVGDSAVFLSTGRPDRPYIGKIEAMWETCGTMIVKVKWFYHPEETDGCPANLHYPGALFESPHVDENDVQTIAHKCDVLPLKEYTERLGDDPQRYAEIYDNNDIYYLAGYYDPTTKVLKMEPDIPFTKTE